VEGIGGLGHAIRHQTNAANGEVVPGGALALRWPQSSVSLSACYPSACRGHSGKGNKGRSGWPPASLSQTPDEWRTHSAQCLEQAAGADILLLYVDRDDARHFGSLIEAGSALGAGKMV
jgi:hypothetical protein